MSPAHTVMTGRDEEMKHRGRRRRFAKPRAADTTPSPSRVLSIRAKPDPRLSRSLELGLAILTRFSSKDVSLGIAELADLIDTSRSTIHRYVSSFVVYGWLEQDSKRCYRLGAGPVDVGMAVLGMIAKQAGSDPVLGQLRDWTGHTAGLGVLNDTNATYVQRVHAHGRGQYEADRDLRTGANVPVYGTALGKALLAGLPAEDFEELLDRLTLTGDGPRTMPNKKALAVEIDKVRSSEGVAVSDEELVPGIRSLAVAVEPALDGRRLAIDLTVPSSASTADALLKDAAPLVKAAAAQISKRLAER